MVRLDEKKTVKENNDLLDNIRTNLAVEKFKDACN